MIKETSQKELRKNSNPLISGNHICPVSSLLVRYLYLEKGIWEVMCKLSGKASISPSKKSSGQNNVNTRRLGFAILLVSAITDSVWITYMNKKVKPLILTSHPAQERVKCSPQECLFSPSHRHKCASTWPGKTRKRKKHWCLVELLRVNPNRIHTEDIR